PSESKKAAAIDGMCAGSSLVSRFDSASRTLLKLTPPYAPLPHSELRLVSGTFALLTTSEGLGLGEVAPGHWGGIRNGKVVSAPGVSPPLNAGSVTSPVNAIVVSASSVSIAAFPTCSACAPWNENGNVSVPFASFAAIADCAAA